MILFSSAFLQEQQPPPPDFSAQSVTDSRTRVHRVLVSLGPQVCLLSASLLELSRYLRLSEAAATPTRADKPSVNYRN